MNKESENIRTSMYFKIRFKSAFCQSACLSYSVTSQELKAAVPPLCLN